MAEANADRARRRKHIIWEALAWLGFAFGAYLLSLKFDGPLPIYRLGAAFWPHVVIIGIAIAALVLLASQFIRGGEEASDAEGNYFDEISESTENFSWVVLVIFVLPLIWVYGMHWMGFLIVTPFFLIAFTWMMGVRRWLPLLSFSLGFYAVLVLVFYKIIFTPLPMGAGWFNALNGEILGLLQ